MPDASDTIDVAPDVEPLSHLSYREAHAALLGAIGLLPGLAWVAGYADAALLASGAVVGLALGCYGARGPGVPAGLETLTREPWYFLSTYLATFVATIVVGGVVA
jgi:hypothetical protein